MNVSLTMPTELPYHQTTSDLTAEALQIRAAQTDPRAFEPLYTNYYKRIVGYVYNRVRTKEEAFEITSLVFYKALENLPKYETRGVPFSAWLFRIAHNELRQYFRKNRSGPSITIDQAGIAELSGDLEDLSAGLDKRLFAALQLLPEEDAELITMRFFEKRSFKEISLILEITESSCKMKLYRILEKLKTHLTKTDHE